MPRALTINPGPYWSLSASYGFLKSSEELNPNVSLHRITASALYGRPVGHDGQWSAAVVYGANKESGEPDISPSLLLESNLDVGGGTSIFGRAEYVKKSARDLVLGPTPPAEEFNIGSLALGLSRDIAMIGTTSAALGVRGSISLLPATLAPTYGSRSPAGISAYLRLRPKVMHMEMAGGMMHGNHARSTNSLLAADSADSRRIQNFRFFY